MRELVMKTLSDPTTSQMASLLHQASALFQNVECSSADKRFHSFDLQCPRGMCSDLDSLFFVFFIL